MSNIKIRSQNQIRDIIWKLIDSGLWNQAAIARASGILPQNLNSFLRPKNHPKPQRDFGLKNLLKISEFIYENYDFEENMAKNRKGVSDMEEELFKQIKYMRRQNEYLMNMLDRRDAKIAELKKIIKHYKKSSLK